MKPYIFWIYPWDVSPIDPATYNPQFRLCKVDEETIEILSEQGQHLLSVNLSDISKCSLWWMPAANRSPIPNAYLDFPNDILFGKEGYEKSSLCFVAIDPLTNWDGDTETTHLVQVINDLRSGIPPNIPRNPYHRALIDHEREDEFSEERWIAENPPSTYTPLPDRRADLWAGLKPVLIIGGITAFLYSVVYALQLAGILK